MTIGEVIKNRTKELGMTQKQLANMVGCTEAQICWYISGKYMPKIRTLIAISKVLDIDLNDFVNGEL